MTSQNSIAVFGEVLFDCFPDGKQVLGGAPFNVAWHLQAFKQAVQFISRVGNDAAGAAIKSAMRTWQMDMQNLQTDPHHPTGTVSVAIANGEPSYHILDQQAYDYIDSQQLKLADISILYYGSLALRYAVSEQALARIKSLSSAKYFVDVNLRQPWWHKAGLAPHLQAVDWLKVNEQELFLLLDSHAELEVAMRQLFSQYQVKNLVVTLGAAGAVALSEAGELIRVKPAANISVKDTVGAGDAFSAILLIGIQQNWPLPLTMQRAQTFAAAIVEHQGATVSDRQFYQRFCQNWGLS